VGQKCPVGIVLGGVHIPMQDCQSLCVVIAICATQVKNRLTLVNTHAHTETYFNWLYTVNTKKVAVHL